MMVPVAPTFPGPPMRYNRLIICFALVSCSCQLVLAQAKQPDPNRQAAERPLAILQEMDGWVSLFNGQDLSGWKGDTAGYVAEDGILVCKKGGKNLISEKEYSDFAFSFEFKLEESGNNGIGIRLPENGHPASDGMEIQILDHHGTKYVGTADMGEGKTRELSWLKPWQYHGSVYGVAPSKRGYLRPVGSWNFQQIMVQGSHVVVELNGTQILDVDIQDLPSNLHDHVGKDNPSGFFGFCGHNDPVAFRAVELKAL